MQFNFTDKIGLLYVIEKVKSLFIKKTGGALDTDAALTFTGSSGIGPGIVMSGGTYSNSIRPAEMVMTNSETGYKSRIEPGIFSGGPASELHIGGIYDANGGITDEVSVEAPFAFYKRPSTYQANNSTLLPIGVSPCKQTFVFNVTDNTEHWETLLRITGTSTPISFVLRTVTEDNYNNGMVIDGTCTFAGVQFTCNSQGVLDGHILAMGKIVATSYYTLAVKIAAYNTGMKILLDVYSFTEMLNISNRIVEESSISNVYLTKGENLAFSFTTPIEVLDAGKTIVNKTHYGVNHISHLGTAFWFNVYDDKYEVHFGAYESYAEFFPAAWASPNVDLGSAIDGMWRNIYAQTSVISTSDRNQKKDIVPMDESARAFIMGLVPSTYKFINGTSDRTHYGLIAQDVEELLESLGLSGKDFAGFIKAPKYTWEEKVIIGEDRKLKKERTKKVLDGEYSYSLRYEEFLAPLIKTIQLQQKEIEELVREVSELREIVVGLLEK